MTEPLKPCTIAECYFNHEGFCAIDFMDYVGNEEIEIIAGECS